MSILNMPDPQPDPAAAVAARVIAETKMTFRAILEAFNGGARIFWSNEHATPEQIAAALGTNAREVFELHAKLGRFIADIDPALIARGMSVVGQFEYNDDGTVTVLSVPSPAE